MEIKIDESIEILSCICLLMENKELKTNFNNVYIYSYVPAIQEELSFLKEKALNTVIQKVYKKDFSNLLNSKEIKKEIDKIKNDDRWRKWWDSWLPNITEFSDYYKNVFTMLDLMNENLSVTIPLLLSKTIIKEEKGRTCILSNFGFCFEEILVLFQNQNPCVNDEKSRLYFNTLVTLEKLKNLKLKYSYWNIPKFKEHNISYLAIDKLLERKIPNYNFVIDNYCSTDIKIHKKNLTPLKNELPSNLLKKFETCKVLLFGEQHCISEHEYFLCEKMELLYEMNFRTICIEIPEKYQENLDNYMNGTDEFLHKSIYALRNFIEFVRNFNEHLSFNDKIKIYCIDFDTSLLIDEKGFKKRENILFENFINIINNCNSKVLGIFGSYHIQKNKIFSLFRSEDYKTLGQNLAEKYITCSINSFGFSGYEKIGSLSSNVYKEFDQIPNLFVKDFSIPKKSDFYVLSYKDKESQTIFITGQVHKKNKKNEVLPFDASLIFKKQTISKWSKIYEGIK